MATTRADFESAFPRLVDELSENAKEYNLPPNALEWFRKSLTTNSMGGKYNRGMSVVDASTTLSTTPLTAEQIHEAKVLGWCTELLQAFFLVSDDIMDSSKTRRGQPCWYLHPNVGMIAINDAFMLESAIYLLLKRYFRTRPYYVDLLELFHTVTFQTELGQLCDLLTAPEDHVDLGAFSMDKFTFIVIYKTAYYSFYLPVALALHLTNNASAANLKAAEDILVPLGEYFQIQDDYLDAFGAPETIGKIGTDIQDNKCSWVINQALLVASPQQRKTLEENYGQKNSEKEARVKAIFKELKLEERYKEYEETRVTQIRQMIDKVDESQGLKRKIFSDFLGKIYKRSK